MSAVPLYAFARTQPDRARLQQFAAQHGWPEDGVLEGDIRTAIEFLKTHASPTLLVVEVPSAAEAPELLNQLADVCAPDAKVIVIGDVNEYSFYVWLTEIGVFGYQLKPLSVESLQLLWQKGMVPEGAVKPAKQPGRVIGVKSMRGGAGGTSVAVYLAALIQSRGNIKVALADLDPQDGSAALLLDLEPSKGFREALEKPDRIDSLFLDRVMLRSSIGFHVLGSEESLAEPVHYHEHAAEIVIRELRQAFDVVVLDLPPASSLFGRAIIKACDTVVTVSEMTLLGLRDTLRFLDFCRDALKIRPPVVVANKIGMAPKFEMSRNDFAKGLGAHVDAHIPFAPDVLMDISGDMPGLKHKESEALKQLRELAHLLVPYEGEEEMPEARKNPLAWLKKGK